VECDRRSPLQINANDGGYAVNDAMAFAAEAFDPNKVLGGSRRGGFQTRPPCTQNAQTPDAGEAGDYIPK